jgi:hypothetical protein
MYQLLSGVQLSKQHFFDVFEQAKNIEKKEFYSNSNYSININGVLIKYIDS